MSALMRGHDWSATSLGPPEQWPDGLKTPLRMMLTSRFEMWLGWGDELAFFYNDAYTPTLGVKHPDALARPLREVWAEIFSDVKDRVISVMREGDATWDKALMLILERSGYPEETYHTFSYSPLTGADGSVQGLMCVASEETDRVISERRLETLGTLATALLPVRSRDGLIQATRAVVATNTRDFPFCTLRFFDDEPLAPIDPLDRVAWPVDRLEEGRGVIVQLDRLLPAPPCGPWDRPPSQALMAPIAAPGGGGPVGVLVLGLNPYRREAAKILDFAQLLAIQIGACLSAIDSHLREVADTDRLRQLFDQSPSFIAILKGPEHRFEMVNPGYLQLIGHREVIGQPLWEALPEVRDRGVIDILNAVYVSGEPHSARFAPVILQRSPGAAPEVRVLDFVYQPIRGADGRVTGVFLEGSDVTDAHDAVLALRESEAQFRTLSEAMLNHVWTARPDGWLDWFNQRAYEYTGASVGELDGDRWIQIVHPDDLDEARQRWAAALQSGEPYAMEFRLRDAGGAYRWHIVRAIAQCAEDGSIIRWIGTNTDIEEQKATAQALVDLNANLEREVAERTGELMVAEETLRQSQKMEAVGQLTGGIAHDFNNLLAGITGSLELLQKRIAQGNLDAVPRYLEGAQSAARRAAALTHRLLAFSRRQTLDPKPANLNRLVAEMEELLRRTVGPGVEIEVVGAEGLWTTLVDVNQMENALLNLCINARDAMPDGGRLTIETANQCLDERVAKERELPPGQYVLLSVTDTGTGMAPDVIARAFDPFFTTKPLGQGTGLGLSMIYGFARQSAGQAKIYSEVGQGTTMCIYLPRFIGLADESVTAVRRPSASAGGAGETILIVDDEPSVRVLLVEVLNEAGYTVIEAGDGPEGLRLLQSDARVDLLITDVGLPGGMNGRQVADAGRVLRPDLKVVFITGYAENAVLRHSHLEPGMEIVTKPFAIQSFAEKIRQMLDR